MRFGGPLRMFAAPKGSMSCRGRNIGNRAGNNCEIRWKSAAQALRRPMPFAEDATTSVQQFDAENAAVLEFQPKRPSDPFEWIRSRIKIDRAFDSMKAWDRKAGSFAHSLISADLIPHLAKPHFVQQEFPGASAFLDQLHHDGNHSSTICGCDILSP